MNITRGGIHYLHRFGCLHPLSVHAFTARNYMLRIEAGTSGVNLLRLDRNMTLDIWIRNVHGGYQWGHSTSCPWIEL